MRFRSFDRHPGEEHLLEQPNCSRSMTETQERETIPRETLFPMRFEFHPTRFESLYFDPRQVMIWRYINLAVIREDNSCARARAALIPQVRFIVNSPSRLR
jgi:hypothetical protein